MLDLNKTLDDVAKPSSVYWYGYLLHRGNGHVLRSTVKGEKGGVCGLGRRW